jgi:hypothetical protein
MTTTIANTKHKITAVPNLVTIVLFTLLLIAVLDGSHALEFLKNASPANKDDGGTVKFTGAETFLKNVRGGFLSLGVPGAGVGLTAAGLMWFTGSRFAKTLAGMVAGGLLLVLFAPNIVE